MKQLAMVALLLSACAGELTPEGTTHEFLVDSVKFPLPGEDGAAVSLPLDTSTNRQNKFGRLLAGVIPLQQLINSELGMFSGFAMRIEFQTRDFNETAAAGVHVNPDLPETDVLFGTTRSGVFTSVIGPGTVKIAVGPNQPLEVPLIISRVQIAGASEGRINNGIIAGAIPKGFLDGPFMNELASQLELSLFACTPDGVNCACPGGSPGAVIVNAFDTNRDCRISLTELNANVALRDARVSDVTINGVQGVTFGMGFTANGGIDF